MSVELSQLDPRIQQLIANEVARQRAAEVSANAPKELTPQERVDAALAGVDAAERRERVGPGHNDHIVGAIVTYLHAVYDRDVAAVAAVSEGRGGSTTDTAVGTTGSSTTTSSEATVTYDPPQAVNSAPAVQAAAPAAGD